MARWPLTVEQQGLLSDLAMLIAHGGTWQFLHGPIVAADEADYPDLWDETRSGVARVLARTLWHAHASFDATLEDARTPGGQEDGLLRNTLLQLAHVDSNAARFVLHHVGNDDIAGIAAHEVGRAFVGCLARRGHPFRTMPQDDLPAPSLGSLATVYLGLGVVAINAAYHSRSRGELSGNLSYHSHTVSRAGGLELDDLALVLAVQAEIRDDVVTALTSLRPTQAEAVAAWRAELEDHEDELRRMLGLHGAADDATALDRSPAPRPVAIVAEFDEATFRQHSHGQRVFRIPETRVRAHAQIGAALGLVGGVVATLDRVVMVLSMAITLGVTAAGFALGLAIGGRRHLYRCANCESFLEATATVCPACGGTIVGDIAHRRDRLDAEQRLELADHPGRSSDEADDDTPDARAAR